jgi:basic amino acid/polyamine antiporter, APA family
LWYKRAVIEPAQGSASRPQLVRAIGRCSLTALTINSVIGSGVFGLPSTLAALMGRASPLAVLFAGACMAVIMACFAEVASYFSEAGGPYLYARVAFGRLMGIQTGWMLWLAQAAAPAANANLFVIYLAEFWPRAGTPVPRFLILTALVGLLAVINVRGVRAGTQVSNFFTAAKLLPLTAVIVMGVIAIIQGHATPALSPTPFHANELMKALLLGVFAYGGFETALTPMGEARNPRRDTVFALFTTLVSCALIYALIQWVVVELLPNAARSDRPLADVARLIMGHKGAAFVTIGALVSFYGYLSAKILATPRVTFALAESGDFPRAFAAVHPRFHTPYISILMFAVLVWLFSLGGSFAWNLTLSAVARLFYYGIGCAALPMVRRKRPGQALFHLPGGPIFAILGVTICVVLLTRVDLTQSLILIATIGVALLNWLWVTRKRAL